MHLTVIQDGFGNKQALFHEDEEILSTLLEAWGARRIYFTLGSESRDELKASASRICKDMGFQSVAGLYVIQA